MTTIRAIRDPFENHRIRVLVASDIHLGYIEEDPVRGDDSFVGFEEILCAAVLYDVDLILLSGNLFHHAKPTPYTLFQCSQLIRKYCFGSKPISIQILSDESKLSHTINYDDPNVNVSFPMFLIHGDKDTDVDNTNTLDVLASTGLVNYFGKCEEDDHVTLTPIRLKKGDTKLAMYGLGHISDSTLARLFAEDKVEMENLDTGVEWFNLLALHQTHAGNSNNNFVSAQVLPRYFELVIWGKEPNYRFYAEDHFCVLQPGSTVATTMDARETLQKHCAIIQIYKKEFSIYPVPLKNVRPFIYKTISLSESDLGDGEDEQENVQKFLHSTVLDCIDKSKMILSDDPKQPRMPVVRLVVYYENESQTIDCEKFGVKFKGLVANPNDVLIMEKEVKEKNHHDIESLILSHYKQSTTHLLSVNAMTEALREFRLNGNTDTFQKLIDGNKYAYMNMLLNSNAETAEDFERCTKLYKESLESSGKDTLENLMYTMKPEMETVQVNLDKINTLPEDRVTVGSCSGFRSALKKAMKRRNRKLRAAAKIHGLVHDDDDDEDGNVPSTSTAASGSAPRRKLRATADTPTTSSTKRKTLSMAASDSDD